MVQEAAKLQTKLRHVDIHSHWLRQEIQRGTITITWQETKKMVADRLTKALGKALFQKFTESVGLEDQGRRLGLIRREDELKEQLKELKSGEYAEEA